MDGRKRILQILNRERCNEKDRELKSFVIEVESIFFGKHLKLTVGSIREKYQIIGRPSQKDFYRICEDENITVVNSLSDPAAKKIKVPCVFKSRDFEGEFFLNFDESLKGRELLRCQFHLLGYYFLHRNELPPAAKQELLAPEIIKSKQEEATLFAIHFLIADISGSFFYL